MVAKSGQAISALPDAAHAEGEVASHATSTVIAVPMTGHGNTFQSLESISPRDPKLAAYIAQMSVEMASMARAAGFDLLAYFLDMARIEANIQSGKDT